VAVGLPISSPCRIVDVGYEAFHTFLYLGKRRYDPYALLCVTSNVHIDTGTSFPLLRMSFEFYMKQQKQR
jgi:hypothetical protein